MARLWRHRGGAIIAAALFSTLLTTAAVAQDLYNRPVLAVDPGMHTARIWSLAVDSAGQFAVTGGGDRTVRIWSVANGELLRTIWIPVGPDPVGDIYAVAISPDGSTVAAGGWSERLSGGGPIYLFDRETGALAQRIELEAAEVPHFLTFSADGRYLAATLARGRGVQVFDRDKGNGWGEEFRDVYEGESYGASFAPDGRLATTSQDFRRNDSALRLEVSCRRQGRGAERRGAERYRFQSRWPAAGGRLCGNPGCRRSRRKVPRSRARAKSVNDGAVAQWAR